MSVKIQSFIVHESSNKLFQKIHIIFIVLIIINVIAYFSIYF